VRPETILRWHRELVAAKWDCSKLRKSVGRPSVSQQVVDLVLLMVREHPTRGYNRIQGALANLGHEISDSTVGTILRNHGIDPVPDRRRQTAWKSFLKAHWDVLAAIDLTTIEVWTKGRLTTFCLLFVMEIAIRRVYFARCTPNPDDLWMIQMAHNLTDATDGFLLSVKEECLHRMLLFGEESLRNDVCDFLAHYHKERNNQGLGNRLIEPNEEVGRTTGEIACRERLGGMLRYYYRKVA